MVLPFSNNNLLSYLFGIITRSLTFRTRVDMHACRKTLLGYLEARAAELKETPENRNGDNSSTKGEPVSQKEKKKKLFSNLLTLDFQIDIFQHLYKSSITRKRWSYQEVIGEILLLQLAIILSSSVVSFTCSLRT
jgi:hypothetical protein